MRQEQAPQLQWLDALSFREIGATPEVFYHTGISEAFDCLIFIRNTSASHLLQFRTRAACPTPPVGRATFRRTARR